MTYRELATGRRWIGVAVLAGILAPSGDGDCGGTVGRARRDVRQGRCAHPAAKCQTCHRVGSMAPMSLVTYEETRPWARSIKARVQSREMPPWHLDKTVGIQHFINDAR